MASNDAENSFKELYKRRCKPVYASNPEDEKSNIVMKQISTIGKNKKGRNENMKNESMLQLNLDIKMYKELVRFIFIKISTFITKLITTINNIKYFALITILLLPIDATIYVFRFNYRYVKSKFVHKQTSTISRCQKLLSCQYGIIILFFHVFLTSMIIIIDHLLFEMMVKWQISTKNGDNEVNIAQHKSSTYQIRSTFSLRLNQDNPDAFIYLNKTGSYNYPIPIYNCSPNPTEPKSNIVLMIIISSLYLILFISYMIEISIPRGLRFRIAAMFYEVPKTTPK